METKVEDILKAANELGIECELNSNNPGMFVNGEKVSLDDILMVNQSRQLNGMTILLNPHKTLREKCLPIKPTDKEVIQKLYELRRWCMDDKSDASGIALPQIGIAKQGFVYRNNLTESYDIVINPKIKKRSGSYDSNEGCLSIPGQEATIKRFEEIEVIYQMPNMKFKQVVIRKGSAACFQHEYDHLQGKLYIDYLEG